MSANTLEQIKSDVQSNKILIYMKGTPAAPQCGFSSATVQLFKSFGYPFSTRDVIADPDLREHLPEFSNWPTFPQVFIGGKLVEALLKKGHDITCMVRKTSKTGILMGKGVSLVTADLTNFEEVMKGFIRARPEIVFHSAANVDAKSEAVLLKTNALGTHNILRVCHERGVKRLVYLSSIAVINGNRMIWINAF